MDENGGLPERAPHVRSDGGEVVANSRDVAAFFGKRHDNVLAAADALRASLDFRAPGNQGVSWFREAEYTDAQGERRRCLDMTRDGFALLAMGFTGAKALAFKVQYIAAFNALEAEARRQVAERRETAEVLDTRAAKEWIGAERLEFALLEMARAVAKVAGGHSELHDNVTALRSDVTGLRDGFDDLGRRLAAVEGGTRQLVQQGRGRRKNVTESTRTRHAIALGRLGGRCACCGMVEVVTASGERLPGFQVDHFNASDDADFAATWPICDGCHGALTYGRRARDAEARALFDAYQAKVLRFTDLLPKAGRIPAYRRGAVAPQLSLPGVH